MLRGSTFSETFPFTCPCVWNPGQCPTLFEDLSRLICMIILKEGFHCVSVKFARATIVPAMVPLTCTDCNTRVHSGSSHPQHWALSLQLWLWLRDGEENRSLPVSGFEPRTSPGSILTSPPHQLLAWLMITFANYTTFYLETDLCYAVFEKNKNKQTTTKERKKNIFDCMIMAANLVFHPACKSNDEQLRANRNYQLTL